jgi:sugar O-acyltransferase (sialic acid O-acetyltransferase NeuD family)
MTTPVAIFGAGGFGREVLQIVLDINSASKESQKKWQPVGFIVDTAFWSEDEVQDLPILGTIDWLRANPSVEIIIAIGSSATRNRVGKEIESRIPNRFPTLIHPRAWVGRNVKIGSGSIICAGSLITTDITIGQHVHINIGTTIGHDAVLHDFVTVNPGVNISGNVVLGEGVEIGTGSVLIPHMEVGPWSIVGAGSVVTRTLNANVTAVGVPARVIKSRNPGWHECSPP